MRGRSIHARAILRQHRAVAPTIAAIPAVTRPAPSARGFISTCESRSARAAAKKLASTSTASASASSKTSGSGSSASSAPSNGGSSSSSSNNSPAESSATTSKAAKASSLPKGRLSPKVKVAGIAPANPPPSSLASVAWESFFSNDRPLLQHGMLPAKSKRNGSHGDSGPLTSFFSADGSLAAFGKFSSDSSLQWRRRMRSIEPERFDQLIDGLADAEESAVTADADDQPIRWLVSSFHPESDRVAVESAKLEEEERIKDEEEEAIQTALDRGEDIETARKLGAEADLIILGEPNGPNPDWSRGVATYLAERGRAYEAPPAPKPQSGANDSDVGSVFMGERVAETVYLTDEDPNLMLSHALVQSSLPGSLQWDAIVAKMDAAALNDPSKSKDALVDVSLLNAKMDNDVLLDSTRRKRKKKMRKHKYKKLRKLQRPERQKLKK